MRELAHKVTLDAADLEALLMLSRASNLAEAEQHAAKVRALLGSEAGRMSELLDTLVERARLLQQLRRFAGNDELTHVANRRAFNETLRRELSRARRSHSTLSLLLLDVDGLKAINDELGHAGGDAALKAVAICLRKGLRDGDLAARIGGDEFAVILPSTSPKDARAIGERIRGLVAGASSSTMKLGVSWGAAVSERGTLDASALLASADAAMYRDKARRKSSGSGSHIDHVA